MDDVKTTGSGERALTPSQTLAMEETKFLPTDVLIPSLLLAIVAYFEIVRNGETSVLGLLVAAPLTSAIFGKPRNVSLISTLTLIETGWISVNQNSELNSGEGLLFLFVLTFALLAIVTSNLRLQKDEQLASALRELASLEILETVASTDWLTGEKNRRGVAQALEEAEDTFQSVAMFDIDGLKKVNDSFGHRVGDDYVKNITARIAANFKATDIFGRWGGDEFIALLPLEESVAVDVVNRVIHEVHSTPIVSNGIEIEARVSAGVAPWSDGADLDQVLADADRALYAAKASGGSRALSFTEFESNSSSN